MCLKTGETCRLYWQEPMEATGQGPGGSATTPRVGHSGTRPPKHDHNPRSCREAPDLARVGYPSSPTKRAVRSHDCRLGSASEVLYCALTSHCRQHPRPSHLVAFQQVLLHQPVAELASDLDGVRRGGGGGGTQPRAWKEPARSPGAVSHRVRGGGGCRPALWLAAAQWSSRPPAGYLLVGVGEVFLHGAGS